MKSEILPQISLQQGGLIKPLITLERKIHLVVGFKMLGITQVTVANESEFVWQQNQTFIDFILQYLQTSKRKEKQKSAEAYNSSKDKVLQKKGSTF